MANTPQFAGAINVTSIDSPTTADNVYTGPTSPPTIYTAGANGSIVDIMSFASKGANTATVARIFRLPGGTGSGYVLWEEVTLPTIAAASATVALAPVAAVPRAPALGPNDTLHIAIGTTIASGYAVTVAGNDL